MKLPPVQFVCNSLGLAYRKEGKDFGEELAGHANGDGLANLSKRELATFWNRQARENLSPLEYEVTKTTWRLQKRQTDRFLVNGWIRGGKPIYELSTEFVGLVANRRLWLSLKHVAQDLGGRTEILWQLKNNSCTWKVDAAHQKIRGSEKYGPNYGLLERQVQVLVPIDPPLPREVSRLKRHLSKVTNDIWQKYGVSIV